MQNVRQIRVSDTIVTSDQLYLSKNIIILQGVKVVPLENYRYKSEVTADFLGRRITAVGNPNPKLPGFNFGDFTVDDAKIDISGARPSWLTAAKIRFFSLAVSLRSAFAASLASLYSGREADIMAGILLGSRDGFPAEFNRRLQQSGLMHLAAASGYNISIVVGVFGLAVSRIIGIKDQIFHRYQDLILHAIKVIIVISFILFYIVISGGQASVVRAGVMGAVGFAASLAGSAASVRRLFAAAALFMLLAKPAWLWDLGFQLSVAATAGMIWGVPWLNRLSVFGSRSSVLGQSVFSLSVSETGKPKTDKPKTENRQLKTDNRKSPWSFLIEPLAASLATAPVLILNLGWEKLSLTAIPANVLATPLVAPLMAASALVGGLGLVAPAVGRLAAVLTRPLAATMLLIIDLSAAANEKLMAIFGG